MLAPLLLVLLGADPEPLTQPKGPPPSLAFLRVVGANVTRTETVLVPITFTVKRKEIVDGKEVERDVTVSKIVEEARQVIIPFSKASVRTVGGKKLTTDQAIKRLSDGAVVALSTDGKSVDPVYLKAFKGETLVIVMPVTGPKTPSVRPIPER